MIRAGSLVNGLDFGKVLLDSSSPQVLSAVGKDLLRSPVGHVDFLKDEFRDCIFRCVGQSLCQWPSCCIIDRREYPSIPLCCINWEDSDEVDSPSLKRFD